MLTATQTLTGHGCSTLFLSCRHQDADLLFFSCGKNNRAFCWNTQTSEVISKVFSYYLQLINIIANAVAGLGATAQKMCGDIRHLANWKEIEEPFGTCDSKKLLAHWLSSSKKRLRRSIIQRRELTLDFIEQNQIGSSAMAYKRK